MSRSYVYVIPYFMFNRFSCICLLFIVIHNNVYGSTKQVYLFVEFSLFYSMKVGATGDC